MDKYYIHNQDDKITESIMINALRYYIMGELRYRAFCPRVHDFFGYHSESDVIAINSGGYLVEFEIKLTNTDFNKDKEKRIYANKQYRNKHEYYKTGGAASRFYFVAPQGVLDKSDIPNWAGFIEIKEKHYSDNVTCLISENKRVAEQLNKRKATDKEISKLLRLLSFKTT